MLRLRRCSTPAPSPVLTPVARPRLVPSLLVTAASRARLRPHMLGPLGHRLRRHDAALCAALISSHLLPWTPAPLGLLGVVTTPPRRVPRTSAPGPSHAPVRCAARARACVAPVSAPAHLPPPCPIARACPALSPRPPAVAAQVTAVTPCPCQCALTPSSEPRVHPSPSNGSLALQCL